MSPHDISILKATVPFLHPGIQPFLQIFLAYTDLGVCLHSLRTNPLPLSGASIINDREAFFCKLASICNPQERNMLEQLQMMENMMQMMNFYRSAEASGGDPMDMMMQMLSPEQQSTFEMLKMMMEMGDMTGDNPFASAGNSET